MKKLPRIQVHTRYIPFSGGLDTETPQMSSVSGRLKRSQNVFQDVNGGYSTFMGYERFDGQPKPSAAQYVYLPASVLGVAVGNTVTTIDSSATGIVAGLDDDCLILG